jgi:uncharacterized protein (DUF1501 family)
VLSWSPRRSLPASDDTIMRLIERYRHTDPGFVPVLEDRMKLAAIVLGPAWHETVLVLITEFGRTARINGTLGTDHGTATVMLQAGGAAHQTIWKKITVALDGHLFPIRCPLSQTTCSRVSERVPN